MRLRILPMSIRPLCSSRSFTAFLMVVMFRDAAAQAQQVGMALAQEDWRDLSERQKPRARPGILASPGGAE